MKRQLLTCCLAICSLATMAQHDEWKNPEINAVKLTKKTQVTF